ncbi:thiamine pyrophosphate-dependent enzyme [Mesorhizobium atlanticum]
MSQKPHIDRESGRHLFKQMLRIRRFEAKCAELYQAQKIRGFLHLYDGEEAVAVGVMQALEDRDAVVATYRDHGHAIARGLPMATLMAEMYGKMEGCSRGRGGSMHFFDRARRFYGGNAIVGGGLPLAIGIAMADKQLRPGAVTACFFGEGAAGEGAFHESINLAELWDLPVLFVCENNLYAMGMPLELAEAETNISRKAAAYRTPNEAVDGMNPIAVEAARQGGRSDPGRQRSLLPGMPHLSFPCSLHVRCAALPRPRGDRAVEGTRPLPRMQKWLEETHMLSPPELRGIEADVEAEIGKAVAFAEQGQWEKIEELERFVLVDEVPE